MKQFFPIVALVCLASAYSLGQMQGSAAQASPPSPAATPSAGKSQVNQEADENANKAKAIIADAIKALGGETYLTMRDREQQGRGYGFHSGRPTGSGGVFWGFAEFPDKERAELTKKRDIAELYVGNKAWEITFKGPHAIEQKDLDEYLRRRRFSLETV